MNILGIHIGHDSGAALVSDGRIVAAVSEERFNRIKHYAGLPIQSVLYCLEEGVIEFGKLDAVAISSSIHDPYLHAFLQLDGAILNRKRATFFRVRDLRNLREKTLKYLNRRYELSGGLPLHVQAFPLPSNTDLQKVDHHLCHAASAYYTSGFDEKTLIVTADGIGDEVSIAVWLGINGKIKLLRSFGSKGSFGWFYGSVTEALGWWVGDGEGKTMGLAPYGDPEAFDDEALLKIMPRFNEGKLVKPYDFGHVPPFRIMDTYLWHIPSSKYVLALIDKYGRGNVAAKAQNLLEQEMLGFIKYWVEREKVRCLATAGGIFLNVKLNQRIIESGIIENYRIFPNAGDGGLPVGAALYTYWLKTHDNPLVEMTDVYWGPQYTNEEIEKMLKERNIPYRRSEQICEDTARYLAGRKIVGWLQGRMEYGPRALGNRSILMDPRKAENKDIINERVKFREPFRPFCPSIISEAAEDYLQIDRVERYMITSYQAKVNKAIDIPAVVHVDGSCRPQIVERSSNPKYWNLIREFKKLTGTPVILNTSFNIKGDPIICTPRDAIKCFYDSGIDVLVLGDYIVEK